MNLYLIESCSPADWDEAEGMVVCAPTEDAATRYWENIEHKRSFNISQIGTADPNLQQGVILLDFKNG